MHDTFGLLLIVAVAALVIAQLAGFIPSEAPDDDDE